MTDPFVLAAMFGALLVGHAIADYPLQNAFGGFIGRNKGRRPVMALHAATHGVFVGAITFNPWLGIAEFATHWMLDANKGRGRVWGVLDQMAHVACKVLWVLLVVYFVKEPI